MKNRERSGNDRAAGRRPGSADAPKPFDRSAVSPDGTREYRLHSTPSHAAEPLSAEMSVAETRVYRTLRDRLQDGSRTDRGRDTLPGLAYSGEQPHPTADGTLGMSDRVTREEMRRREEFPYG